MTHHKSHAKQLVSYFSFSVASSILGFLSSLILLRFILPAEVGRISVFFSLLFFVSPLLSLAADGLIAVNKMKYSAEEYLHFKSVYITFAYFLSLIAQVICFIIYFAGYMPDSLLLLLPLYGLTRFMISVISIEYILEGKSVEYGMLGLVTSVSGLALTLGFLKIFSATANWRVFAMLSSELLFILVHYRKNLRSIFTITIDKKMLDMIIKFGMPLLFSASAAGWALNESDKVIVAHYLNVTSLGYYAAACSVGGVMLVFNQAIVNAISPRFYEELRVNPQDSLNIIKRYVKQFLVVGAGFGCLFAMVYGLLAPLMLPEKYAASRQIVYVLILFNLPNGIYKIVAMAVEYYHMTVVKSVGVTLGGGVTILVTIFGVIQFGLMAAAMGTGIGYLVLSAFLWFKLVKKFKTAQVL